jgi:hypothetical protein
LFGRVIVETNDGAILDDVTDWNVERIGKAVEDVTVLARGVESELELVVMGFGRWTDQVDPLVTHSLIL